MLFLDKHSQVHLLVSAKSKMHGTKRQENRALNLDVNYGHKKTQNGQEINELAIKWNCISKIIYTF